MLDPKFYTNGVRIGDWFLRSDGKWLHYHRCGVQFSRKWNESVEGVCPTCHAEVPPEIQMHGRLQCLRPKKDSVETFWPVIQSRGIGSSGPR